MDEKIIFIYCVCSDLADSLFIKDDPQRKMNTAEVMTVAVSAALFFGGNFSQARIFLKIYNYIHNMLSESRLNRCMHEIIISVWQSIFQALVRIFEEKELDFEYLVDSMPIEVCMNVRSYRCKLSRLFFACCSKDLGRKSGFKNRQDRD